MTDNPLLLREVAKKLKNIRQFRNSHSAGKLELLNFLRTEKIKARVDFPSKKRPAFYVPAKYWLEVRPGNFQTALTRRRDEEKEGDYLISASYFVDEYIAWFSKSSPRDEHELKSALLNAKRKIVPYVFESEWSKFVSDTGLDTTEIINEQKRSKAGAPEHEKWAPILVQIAAILIADEAKQAPQVAAEKIAEKAMERVEQALGKGDMLKIETVAVRVRQIRQEVGKLKRTP
jgi:hypothetical protein